MSETIKISGVPVIDGDNCANKAGRKLCDLLDISYNCLISLDALRPVWEKIGAKLLLVTDALLKLRTPLAMRDKAGYWKLISGELCLLTFSQPHHHVEALARTLEVDCGECGGTGKEKKHDACCQHLNYCPTCSGTCKRPILSIWEEEVNG